MKPTFFLLLLTLWLLPAKSAQAEYHLTLGILAFRPAPQVEARWMPLVEYLQGQLPEVEVRLKSFDYDGLEEAVQRREVDLVLTNPAHYVLIAQRAGLSSPLASQINLVEGVPVKGFGGVILVPADDRRLQSLKDLKGKRIATPALGSLGGYQMQAHALARAGLRVPRDIKIVETGMPHDRAVEALLEGRADAAFVRSGLYEALLREGRVAPARLRILNEQAAPDFPHRLSTPLYPEWPIAAMPQVDDALAARVASALLALPHGGETAAALGIHGFTVPYNYEPVRNLLETLRLPPFDAPPQFTWQDIQTKHGGLLILFAFGTACGSLLLIVLTVNHRRMRAAQAALRLSEGLLNEAQKMARIGNWELDLTTNRLHWSLEIFHIFEIDPDRFTPSYEAFLDAIHPEDRDLVNQAYTQSLKDRQPYDIVHRLRFPDGRIRFVHERCSTTFSEDGTPLVSRGIVQDITERKLAEEALRASENNYRNLFENMAVGFAEHEILLDTEGRPCDYRFLQINPAFEQLTGLKAEAILGRTVREVMPETEPFWIQTYGRVALGGEPLRFENFSGALGKHFEVSVYMPKPGRFATIFLDISERKRQEEELRQAKTDAESANLAKSRFLATMSHEIRTPLNGILGMAQMLKMPEITSAERQECAQTILDSGQTLLVLLNDILDLSKVEAGKLVLNERPCDPAQLLQESVALFAQLAQTKGLRLEARPATRAPQAYWCDAFRLRQMLSNLISNAIKFTNQGSIHVDVEELEGDGQSAVLRFSVRDSGVGVAEDQQRLLFKPFTQIDDSDTRAHGGSGLGLSIVRNLATLMGGEVGCSSAPGQGSTFWFSVRVRLADADDLRSQAADQVQVATGETSAPRERGRILVVDDHLLNRKLLTGLLGKRGFAVDQAENGEEALALLTGAEPPELILMDCQMPIMDGYEATTLLRRWEQDNNRPRLPIIALTAGAFEEDRKRCLAAGMDDFLTKPVYFDQLFEMLDKWLGS
ncbi:PhnD/SsuA/transferrin family substrate-binding protein [Geoalkalibacter sp.]|uniref:PhnD/SsuA/transferrin family substrate-binding protein n=1 Tax=Geoalkalibacter sp. TaxID=3041440 RepID=UPI00272E661E|nr:PhnD/SsuA/transferrin family substrate-binding protein [Geoalkalibacter sp.]